MKIMGVYKIHNIKNNRDYIGSSRDIHKRWAVHKTPSTWKSRPNRRLYLDMWTMGIKCFEFSIIEEVDDKTKLKETEQKWIDELKPFYNTRRAKGIDIERHKKYLNEYVKQYHKDHKEVWNEYQREYQKRKRREGKSKRS